MIGLTPVQEPSEVRLGTPRRAEPVDDVAARILAEEHALRLHRDGSRPYCPVCYPGGPAARALSRRARSQPQLRGPLRTQGEGRKTWLTGISVTWILDAPVERWQKRAPAWADILRARPGETARVEVWATKDSAAHRAKRLRDMLPGYNVGIRGPEVFARYIGGRR